MRFIRLSATLAASTCAWNMAGAAQTVSYTYDALGRLTQVQILGGPGSGTTQIFQYDPAGNRLQQSVTAPGQTPTSLSVSSSAVNVSSAGVTLTVNVSGSGAGGTVTFTENGVFLGRATVTNGQATIILQSFPAGSHSITATYSGDGTYQPRISSFNITVRDLRWLPAVLQLLLSN